MRQGRGRDWAVFATAMTLTVCGAAWMTSTWEYMTGNGVTVHKAEPAPTGYWTPERIKKSEPVEMPVVQPCRGWAFLFDPDCW